MIENAWLMYFTVCEVNIKCWNKSTVDWTLEIIVPYGQIWLNLLMHDCHCGYIFLGKSQNCILHQRKNRDLWAFLCEVFHPSSNVCLCHQNYHPCSCHPTFAYCFRTCLLLWLAPVKAQGIRRSWLGEESLFFHWSQNWRKQTHTPFWEKRYKKEQQPSKGHKRVPKVTAGIEYSAVNSKRAPARPIAAATPN